MEMIDLEIKNRKMMIWKNLILIVLLIIPILGGLLVIQTPLYVSSDSTKYLLGARFLAQGKGYIEFADEDVIVYNRRWPPAYSTFIALGIKAGLNEIQSARLVNFAAWCILFLTWMAFFQRIFPNFWTTIAYFLMLLSWGLWMNLSMILSETLFVAFLGLVGWSLTVAMSSEQEASIRTRWLILGAFALMGVGLTRYAGLPIIIATGFAVLLTTELSKRERLKAFSILMAISLGGNFLWMLRNKFLTGQATLITAGSAVSSLYQLNLSYIPQLCYRLWREAVGTPYSLACYLGWIFPLLLVLLGITLWNRRSQLKRLDFASIWIILSVIFYLAMLFILQASDSRYLWVLQPFTVAILVKVISFLHHQLQGKPLFSVIQCCYVAFASILLLTTVTRMSRCITTIDQILQRKPSFDNVTVEPFCNSQWVFQWVKLNYRKGDLMFSNFSDFIYFVTNCPCWGINEIEKIYGISGEVKDIITKGIFQGRKNIYFILYKDNLWRKSYLLPWQEYCRIFPHQVIREDKNAIIIRLLLPKPQKEQKPKVNK